MPFQAANILPVFRICHAVCCNLLFVLVTYRKQHSLGHDVFTAILEGVFKDARLDDGVHRAGFLAEAAVDALEQVDVVTGGAPRAVVTLFRLNGDRQCRTYRLAQLAGNATLLAIGVTAQCMQTLETG